jgi:uncharacterized protein YndB with AHSA1/START domain
VSFDITQRRSVMNRNLTARATISIQAPTRNVWDALVTPQAIKEYMFGTDVESEWSKGSAITWKGEMNGRKYADKGVILIFKPEEALQYTHFSPLSGKPDTPENYHTVTIELAGNGNSTAVTLSQDNNADEKGRLESEKNWGMMLAGLKTYVEGSARPAAAYQARAATR